jgi:hypothetical protein
MIGQPAAGAAAGTGPAGRTDPGACAGRPPPRVPTTPTEITNRLNEIACQNVLAAELLALPASVRLRIIDADDALLHLPISSKVNGEAAFLKELFEVGRTAAAR